jgi:hypothetical protein
MVGDTLVRIPFCLFSFFDHGVTREYIDHVIDYQESGVNFLSVNAWQ